VCAIDRVINNINKIDILVVDGRNRVVCFKHALKYLENGGCVLFDDIQRSKYKEARYILDTRFKYNRLFIQAEKPKNRSRKITGIYWGYCEY
jgi:hypothetical protein